MILCNMFKVKYTYLNDIYMFRKVKESNLVDSQPMLLSNHPFQHLSGSANLILQAEVSWETGYAWL